jgi:hypothetical protein
MEILFLSTVLPHRRAGGGEIATHAVLDALQAAGHEVTVVGHRRAGEDRRPPPGWIEVGRRAIETDDAGRLQVSAWVASALARRLPYSAAKYRSRTYVRAVRSLARSGRFELAVIDHAQIGWIRPELERAGLPFVLSSHNVEGQLYAEQEARARGARSRLLRREARLIGRLEEEVARRGRGVWSFTQADAAHFRRFGQAWTIPVHSSFTAPPPKLDKQCDVALMGTWTWDATRAALVWFLEHVHPRLPSRLTVEVAGRGGDWIDGIYPGVRYRGFVPDPLEFLAAARVVAVPGVGGTGVQIKTLDAIASGAQVVASPAAVRDLATPPSSVHVAGSPEEFADQLKRLATAPGSRAPSRAALEWTRERRAQFQEAVAAAAAGAVAEP